MPNDFLVSPPLILNIILVIIALLLIAAIVYFLRKTQWLKRFILTDAFEFINFKSYEAEPISKTWNKILERLENGTESEVKLAVIEADDLLNNVLIRMGYSGESLGERLKQVSEVALPNKTQVIEAHMITGNIIHDPDYRLKLTQARGILEVYRQAFLHLNAL